METLWLVPVSALALAILGWWRAAVHSTGRTIGIVAVAGITSLGHVAGLMVLQHPARANAMYQASIDPGADVGPAYWLSLLGLTVALIGSVVDLAPQPGGPRERPRVITAILAGAAAGVTIGTVLASVVLDGRQEDIGGSITLLPAGAAGDATFGPNFAVDRTRWSPILGHR